jgi:hypothetical protein
VCTLIYMIHQCRSFFSKDPLPVFIDKRRAMQVQFRSARSAHFCMVSQYSEDHTTPRVHKLNYITLVTAIPKKTNHLNYMPNWRPSWMQHRQQQHHFQTSVPSTYPQLSLILNCTEDLFRSSGDLVKNTVVSFFPNFPDG